MTYRNRAEISDLIIRYDPTTGARIPICQVDVLKRCDSRYARSIIEKIPHSKGFLCNDAVDKLLIQSHGELQRLWEEFFHAQRVSKVIKAIVGALRASGVTKKIRLVDVGCGIGYMLRWLATHHVLIDDITFIGVDYNEALIGQAQKLAKLEGDLSVSFQVANAFELEEPADIFISSGVLHHCRKDGLRQFFQAQSECQPMAFAHFDPQYSWATPIGSFMFHFSRMRTPLARYDGWLSAVRAHSGATLERSVEQTMSQLTLFRYHPPVPWFPLIRTMTGVMGISPNAASEFEKLLDEPMYRIER